MAGVLRTVDGFPRIVDHALSADERIKKSGAKSDVFKTLGRSGSARHSSGSCESPCETNFLVPAIGPLPYTGSSASAARSDSVRFAGVTEIWRDHEP